MPFDHFNAIAGFYDRVGKFSLTEPLSGLLSLSPNSLLLDVGGGTGRVAAALRGMVKEVFVADVSHGMVRRSANKGLPTVCAPAESLPFPSECFDRIIMMDALHHVLDQRLTAQELWRILCPGGRIVIVEPDIHKVFARIIAIGEKVLLMRSHFLSGDEISALFHGSEARVDLFHDEFNVFFIAERVKRM
jgi:ubiquinone/menaquinone biosynthesis C-methylase UbiE